jgi:glycolate oxidase FAD binding subunit
MPDTEDAVRDAVAAALADDAPLEIVGAGSKRGLGRPVTANRTLSLAGLSGITLYEPAELVLTAKAGTKLAEIGAALAEENQQLAFEPPDWGPLLGGDADGATIGGVIAANLSGARRFHAGAARDHLLGARMVTGRGEIIKTGGRVVKNVTGYDLCKLLAGSYGTLAALTEVTVKVLPRPDKTRTLLLFGQDEAAALEAMTAALNGPHEVSGAAWLPAELAARSAVGHVAGAGASVTAVRVEGPEPSVEARCAALRVLFAGYGAAEALHFHNSATFWAEIGDGAPFVHGTYAPVWRVSAPPADLPRIAAAIRGRCLVELYADWGGGLVWVRVAPDTEDAGAAAIRGAIAPCGGHATLIRADADIRARVPVFQPAAPAVAALTARLKHGFDPAHILNRGRMVERV